MTTRLLLTLALSTRVAAQGLFERVSVPQPLPLSKLCAEIGRQTGVRLTRLALPGEGAPAEPSARAEGLLGDVLRAVAESTGVRFTRTGAYDWLVVGPLAKLVTALPHGVAGGWRVQVTAVRAPAPRGLASADEPWRLDLGLSAGSELAVAAAYEVDLDSLRLFPDQGPPRKLVRAAWREPSPSARRAGWRVSLPFEPPATGASVARLGGQMVRYEQVAPVTFQFAAQTPGRQDQGEVTASLAAPSRLGDLWVVTLVLGRPAVVGDHQPWIDAALQTADAAVHRPLEPHVEPLAAPDDDEERVWSRHRLAFRLPAGGEPGRLWFQVLDRRRPWARVAFEVTGIPLHEAAPAVAPVAAGAGATTQER